MLESLKICERYRLLTINQSDWTYAALYFVMAVSQFTWAESG